MTPDRLLLALALGTVLAFDLGLRTLGAVLAGVLGGLIVVMGRAP